MPRCPPSAAAGSRQVRHPEPSRFANPGLMRLVKGRRRQAFWFLIADHGQSSSCVLSARQIPVTHPRPAQPLACRFLVPFFFTVPPREWPERLRHVSNLTAPPLPPRGGIPVTHPRPAQPLGYHSVEAQRLAFWRVMPMSEVPSRDASDGTSFGVKLYLRREWSSGWAESGLSTGIPPYPALT